MKNKRVVEQPAACFFVIMNRIFLFNFKQDGLFN